MKNFWLIQRESLRRASTPFIMYFFMGGLMLASLTFTTDMTLRWIMVVAILALAIFYNFGILASVGELGYKSFCAGEVRRLNNFSLEESKDYKPYQEYRLYKGFLAGFYIALPVAILIVISALGLGEDKADAALFYGLSSSTTAAVLLLILSGWSFIPILLLRMTFPAVSLWWSLLFTLIPVLTSGIAYIYGAMLEKKRREDMEKYRENVMNAGKKKK